MTEGSNGNGMDIEPLFNKVHDIAKEIYAKKPDWVTFFREVFGVSGFVRQHLETPAAMMAFERSGQYRQIQAMMGNLRDDGKSQTAEVEQDKVITVRLPPAVHAALKVESHDRRMSMNQLCLTKLLQPIQIESVARPTPEPAAG